MKFGKQFVSQMVPEWHEAYMDYAQLKALQKEIISSKLKNKPTSETTTTKPHPPGLNRKALYRAFSGLVQRHHETPIPTTAPPDIENQVIQVNSVNNRDGTHSYETMFLKSGDEGTEYELVYFNRLDDEFNKVNSFYMSKVKEVLEEAVMLEKQMHALVAFRIKVEKPDRESIDLSAEMTPLAPLPSSDDVEPLSLSASSPKCRRVTVDVIEEGTRSQEQSDESSDEKDVDKEDTKHNMEKKIQEQTKPSKSFLNGNKPCPLQILDRVKMNVTPETPLATIKVLLNVPNQTELKFNKENLKSAEEQLKQAFSVFYHKLLLLRNYSFMNMLAFSKIMKKYDKITSRHASRAYMKMVDKSILGNSTDVSKLIERVEATFIKHFTNSNRAKGMKILRPKAKKERHRVTFSLGFFAGCTVALILALILIIRARNILDHEGGSQYMNTMFPLYSLFGFVVLHMLMYAGNIYFWRRYRVNYSFIFGFRQGTELGYREVLYLSFGLTVLALASVLSNLDMEMDPRTLKYEAYTELLPLTILVVVVGILICPFNIIYRSSRFFFLSCVFHCLCAPLYKVTLPDSIVADQLTSQVQAIRSLEFYVCYYSSGKYLHRQNTCKENDAYNTFYFIVAAIPYVMRFLQCLRRLYEEKDPMHAYNGLKYFATVAAVCTRTAYSLQGGTSWRIVAFVSSGIAAIISTYWDIVLDWGLLQRNSKNFCLRDKLLIPHKSVYFVAMVLNVLLRFAWLQTVSNFKVPVLHTEALGSIVASLEIIRRGIWNFFRLENEHLNNVGKFRAFKSVPLPFNYDENEEKNV